jgi:transposase
MLADEVDFVIGVDTHRDRHALAVVAAARGVVCRESMIATTPSGYRAALELANQHAPGRRVFALEGSGCYGRGLARFLAARDQRIVEVERPRRERRPRAKSDALDVIAAARAALSRPLAAPRAGGTREALRVLVTTREGAIAVRRAGLNQLRALLVAAPEPLRAQLRTLTRARLLARCTRLRPQPSEQVELRASKLALRSCARRVRAASEEARELDREIDQLVRALAPSLLDEPGVGPVSPPRSCSPGRTKAGSSAKQRSHDSPAPRRSRPPPARRSAIDSTAVATDNSTAPCTPSCSPAANTTPKRSPISTGAHAKARLRLPRFR